MEYCVNQQLTELFKENAENTLVAAQAAALPVVRGAVDRRAIMSPSRSPLVSMRSITVRITASLWTANSSPT
jgi:hypothetical protein